MSVCRDTYSAADSVTTRFWPHHNAEQGIRWSATSVGLVARDANGEVGAATIKMVGGAASLEQLVVAPGRKGQGIGTQLMLEFERVAKEAGCHVLELETAETQARPFYEKHGFVVVGTRSKSKFELTWFAMEKRLNGK